MDGSSTMVTSAAPSTLTSIARLQRRGETNCDGVGTCELLSIRSRSLVVVEMAEIEFNSHLPHRHLLHRSRWLRRLLLSVGNLSIPTISMG